jgi:hypothetical protein
VVKPAKEIEEDHQLSGIPKPQLKKKFSETRGNHVSDAAGRLN